MVAVMRIMVISAFFAVVNPITHAIVAIASVVMGACRLLYLRSLQSNSHMSLVLPYQPRVTISY